MESEKLNKIIDEHLDEVEKARQAKEWRVIHALVEKAYVDYNKRCENDKELLALVQKYVPIVRALSYEREKDRNFFVCWQPGTESERDIYSEYDYNKALEIYRNWPQDKEKIEKQMEELDNKTFVFNRKAKKAILNQELRNVDKDYNAIKESLEKESIKADLIENKSDKIKLLLKNINTLEKEHAMEVAKEYVAANPVMTNQEISYHDPYSSLDGHPDNRHSPEFLVESFNEIRTETLQNDGPSM